jgi:hypothetical protein
MSDPFTLQVPADSRYRVIGPEVAARFVEVLGGTAGDRQAVATLVTDALAALLGEGDQTSRGVCDLAFTPGADGLEIAVTCGAGSRLVQYPLQPARPGTAR